MIEEKTMESGCSKMKDFAEILTDLGYTLRDYGKEYRTRPLYRESDNDTILTIEKSTGKWYDFKELRGGAFEELVRRTLKLPSTDEASEWLKKKDFTSEGSDAEEKPLIKDKKIFSKEVLSRIFSEHEYWNKRGISTTTLKIFEGGVVRSGRMKDRYVFPILDGRNNLVGFSGRDLLNLENSKRPKWKHIGDKSNWKYPLQANYKTLKSIREIILVESIGDMLALWENEIQNIIVTFGLDVSTSVVNLLLKLDPNKIYISFNNDSSNNNAGNVAAEKAKRKLLKYFDRYQIQIALPDKKDFGEMDKEEIDRWGENNIEDFENKKRKISISL
jgi:hypothetical protein